MGIDPFVYISRKERILKSTQSYTQFKTQTALACPSQSGLYKGECNYDFISLA
jgi:hypothetical protein